ncbi:MAG: 2-dehydro-3-deoxygalactonokinase [Pseudomonadota bacterium]
MTALRWIGVDWGTSRVRAWAMAGDGAVVASTASEAGMGRLDHAGFEPALLDLVAPWLGSGPVDVIACGMVGARHGWHEVGYVPVPVAPAALRPEPVPATDRRVRVAILPGLSQAKPPDVMRGEETQIAGFLTEHPDFDGVLCLPGTHSKWVRISAGEVVSFQTAMTGEMFELLANRSVLRHSVATAGTEPEAFDDAVHDALSQPERLAQRLFSIRSEAVLNDLSPEAARARLSGLLIGAELAAMRGYWLGHAIAIAGTRDLSAAYARALGAQGVTAGLHDAERLARAGLAAAYAQHMAETP